MLLHFICMKLLPALQRNNNDVHNLLFFDAKLTFLVNIIKNDNTLVQGSSSKFYYII